MKFIKVEKSILQVDKIIAIYVNNEKGRFEIFYRMQGLKERMFSSFKSQKELDTEFDRVFKILCSKPGDYMLDAANYYRGF